MFGIFGEFRRRWREGTEILRRRDELWKETMRRRLAEEPKTTAEIVPAQAVSDEWIETFGRSRQKAAGQ